MQKASPNAFVIEVPMNDEGMIYTFQTVRLAGSDIIRIYARGPHDTDFDYGHMVTIPQDLTIEDAFTAVAEYLRGDMDHADYISIFHTA